jgi:hypothetical protein
MLKRTSNTLFIRKKNEKLLYAKDLVLHANLNQQQLG